MPFSIEPAPIPGMFLVHPRIFPDDRGFFMESWKRSDFAALGINEVFVQDNHSASSAGVLRGLHFQRNPHAQGKLVRVVRGAVWDVGVDLRIGSPTYGNWFGTEISAKNHIMLYIPSGFAHGFYTLEDETHLMYKCTAEFNAGADGGIRWDDPDIGINWPFLNNTGPILSDKDRQLPYLKDIR